jgi:hypothetical protein
LPRLERLVRRGTTTEFRNWIVSPGPPWTSLCFLTRGGCLRLPAIPTGGPRAVLERHAGTVAARLAGIEIANTSGSLSKQLDDLDAIAASEPGTIVAAKARYTKAFQLAHNHQVLVQQGADPDPTERLLEMLAIVRDLESGRYPPCEWL